MIFVGLATLSLVGCFAASAMLSQQQNAAAAPAKLTSWILVII
jgi:hypothetical protein